MNALQHNRIRVVVARDFDWRPGGPIRQFFIASGQAEFLDAAFVGAGEQHVFMHGMLTREAQQELQLELLELRRKFANGHESSLSADFSERQGVGLLFAVRAWEPAFFARFRR